MEVGDRSQVIDPGGCGEGINRIDAISSPPGLERYNAGNRTLVLSGLPADVAQRELASQIVDYLDGLQAVAWSAQRMITGVWASNAWRHMTAPRHGRTICSTGNTPVDDLSLGTNILLLATVSLWLAHGVMPGDRPLIAANVISAPCIGTIITAKLAWGRRP